VVAAPKESVPSSTNSDAAARRASDFDDYNTIDGIDAALSVDPDAGAAAELDALLAETGVADDLPTPKKFTPSSSSSAAMHEDDDLEAEYAPFPSGLEKARSCAACARVNGVQGQNGDADRSCASRFCA
jgi:hypothetical protein